MPRRRNPPRYQVTAAGAYKRIAVLEAMEAQFAAQYGLVPNGVDDTAAIQARLTATGSVLLGPGTFLATGLVYDSVTSICGAGEEVTILKLKDGSNADLLISKDFALRSLSTGGDGSNGGTHDVSFSNLTLDGNLTGNTSGWCLRQYGLSHRMSNIVVRFGASGGVWSEWYNGNTKPAGALNFAESYWLNFKIHSNKGPGVVWEGPHDSTWVAGIVYENSNTQPGVTDGVQISNNGTSVGGPLQIYGLHSWGSNQRYALNVGSNSVHCMGCTFEGARGGAQVKLDAHKFHMVGGEIYRNSNTRIASTSLFTLASSTSINFADTSALATSGGMFHPATGVQILYTGKTGTSITGVTVVRGMGQTSVASGQTWSSAGVGILLGDGTAQNYGQIIVDSCAMATLEFGIMVWGGGDGGTNDIRFLPFNVTKPLPVTADCSAITTGVRATAAVSN